MGNAAPARNLAGKVKLVETLHGRLITKDNVKDYAKYLVGLGDSADVPPRAALTRAMSRPSAAP